jgi:hypothetical protein
MDEFIINTVPAKVDTNYEAVKTKLESEIEQYNIVVTADTVGEAKKLATKLNKVKQEIARRRKEEVAKITAPGKDLDVKVKELEAMCEEGRQKILVQVESFESATLKLAKIALEELLEKTYKDQKIGPEFQTATVDNLVKLSGVTASGRLTKASREGIAAKVAECEVRQTRTALRLSELENESHKAGLQAPLSREHIAGFLFEEDDQLYANNLSALIDRELERQAETLEKAAELEEPTTSLNDVLDAAAPPEIASALSDDPEPIEEPPFDDSEDMPPSEQPATVAKKARVVAITVRLEVDAPASASNSNIVAALKQKLINAGVEKSIRDIQAIDK